MHGEPEAWLEEIALTDIEPEDACLGVIDHDDPDTDELVAITAFTSDGIEALKDAVDEARKNAK